MELVFQITMYDELKLFLLDFNCIQLYLFSHRIVEMATIIFYEFMVNLDLGIENQKEIIKLGNF